jgi:hypothetical protein
MTMMLRMAVLVAAAFLPFTLVLAADPMGSAPCQAARAELDAALSDASGGGPDRAKRRAQARREASRACLGPARGQPERSGAPYPAQTVPPPAISVAPANAPRLPPVAPPPPALEIARPAQITNCDPGGCWDSQGRRLNQIGPVLIGPQGPCSTQGGVVTCP